MAAGTGRGEALTTRRQLTTEDYAERLLSACNFSLNESYVEVYAKTEGRAVISFIFYQKIGGRDRKIATDN
jgi:hypothetical protein